MKKTIFPLLLIIALAANGQLLNVQSIEPLNIQQQDNLTTQAVAISPRVIMCCSRPTPSRDWSSVT